MNKKILRLAIPFIISNITVPLVGTVDTSLMGYHGSQAHLGAIGLGSSIFSFLYWNFAFIRMSMAGMAAQAYGAKDKKELTVLLGRSIVIALVAAFLLLVLQEPLARLTFWISKGDVDVEQYALEYFYVRIWAAPATIVMYSLIGWLIGMQNAKAPMLIALLINGVNIGVSAFLVIGLGMKATGVAWGTVIAQYLGLGLAIIIMFVKYREYLVPVPLSQLFQGSSFIKYFKVNRNVFIRTFFVMFVLTYYNFASAEQGKLILGVNVIFLQLIYTFSFFIDGFANAAEAIIGRYVGALEKVNLKKAVRSLFQWGSGLGVAFTVAYILIFDLLVRIFTNDPAIISKANEFSYWIMLLPLVSFTAFVWDGIYLGATATREYLISTLMAAVIFFVLYYGLRNTIGNHALLLSQLSFFAIRGIIQTFYYKTAILERFFKQ